jgi:hypothetical protein
MQDWLKEYSTAPDPNGPYGFGILAADNEEDMTKGIY